MRTALCTTLAIAVTVCHQSNAPLGWNDYVCSRRAPFLCSYSLTRHPPVTPDPTITTTTTTSRPGICDEIPCADFGLNGTRNSFKSDVDCNVGLSGTCDRDRSQCMTLNRNRTVPAM